ncbi:MAG TPA: CDP-alcohol phosphatidyltransferase family protein [Phenylobacterium sp.]|jgi:phosphatidylcholine synthase|uniref:CDP-alcohol phosphatidyltransferase family protein n=1 Tax=Phenylobacterium sp. TaxID=1871053 RepID=UPI002CFF9A17|nr:CDP-alcohol phosphatidyltransferase family protein [Phenylobacterium sp.]HXA37970.1 CDP-alcohol phosphatidyltransferase family protein [Phenylobacterium sp.]
MNPPPPPPSSLAGLVRAWLVHGLTASGAVLAFLALLAVEKGAWGAALAWLTVALMIDGIDGPLARWSRVDRVTPTISGATLDLVVDYLTFVFVPALFIYRAGLVPAPLALAATILILVSSLYHYARSDLKTEDNYFRGFPALWNLVAFYLFACRAPQAVGFAVVCLCAALTFLPVLFVHPVRVREHRRWLAAITGLWVVSSVLLLAISAQDAGAAGWRIAAVAGSTGSLAALLVFGGLRTIRGPRAGLA